MTKKFQKQKHLQNACRGIRRKLTDSILKEIIVVEIKGRDETRPAYIKNVLTHV